MACSIVYAATATDVCRAKIKNTFPTLECAKFEKVPPPSLKFSSNRIEKYVKFTWKTMCCVDGVRSVIYLLK